VLVLGPRFRGDDGLVLLPAYARTAVRK
jgi:hypothetical protein